MKIPTIASQVYAEYHNI